MGLDGMVLVGNGIGRRGEGSGRKEERIGLFECWELEIGERMKRERKKDEGEGGGEQTNKKTNEDENQRRRE